MSEFKNVKELIVESLVSVAPIAIVALFRLWWGKSLSIWIEVGLIVLAYFLTAILVFLFNKYICERKKYRKYKKFEGRWIEIISGFPRYISICHLSFDNEGYHFYGSNYINEKEEPISFTSKKFIPNSEREFYYITKNDNSIERFEGYGKVYAISESCRGFFWAKGYFFDVSSNSEQKIHNTIMIKFDEKFYNNQLKNINRNVDPSKFTDLEVYNCVKDYVNDNYITGVF